MSEQKLRGIFTGYDRFKAAGGAWDPKAIQWVGYWDEHDRDDPTILEPWCDFTLMVWSEEVGDSRPATEEDLRLLGYVKEENVA